MEEITIVTRKEAQQRKGTCVGRAFLSFLLAFSFGFLPHARQHFRCEGQAASEQGRFLFLWSRHLFLQNLIDRTSKQIGLWEEQMRNMSQLKDFFFSFFTRMAKWLRKTTLRKIYIFLLVISEVTGTNFVRLVMVSGLPLLGFACVCPAYWMSLHQCCLLPPPSCFALACSPFTTSHFYFSVFCLFHFFLIPHSLDDPFVG